MDSERLIEEITELVYRQLTGGASQAGSEGPAVTPPVLKPLPPADPAPPPNGSVLFVMGEGRRGLELLPAQVKTILKESVRLVVVPSDTVPASRVAGVLGDVGGALRVLERPPSAWHELVRDSRAVIVPNLTVHAAAGIALLAGLEPCAAAAIQALIEGRPVLAGCEEVNFLTMNAAHLAKPFLDVLRGHLNTVQSLGVRLVEMKTLGEEVAGRLRTHKGGAAGEGRGRNVLTKDDVETLLRSGARAIEVANGTIVTPLARDEATAAGVEIVFR